jgi:large subunit ribosomal protein L4e
MSRPLVAVQSQDAPGQVAHSRGLPAVFTAPIRNDIVHFVHTQVAKNRRQAQGVAVVAGKQVAAESWGTGRAVARIPRVGGSGTHRSGQAAFGNMCRGGHMFSPLKIWRKWHRKTNQNQKRHAVASAIAATAVAPLVLARGHRIEKIAELPLVIDEISGLKTANLIKTLITLGCEDELRRCSESKKLRSGQGKLRNRRYVIRKGPLIVYNDEDHDVKRLAKNIVGVDVCNVNRLNILNLAPGGTLGRFVIWTDAAFNALNNIFGTYKRDSQQKSGYTLQRNVIQTADISRLINSDSVQSAIRAPQTNTKLHSRKINPLRNKGALRVLNPFAAKKAEEEQKIQQAAYKNRKAAIKAKRTTKDGKARHTTSLNTQAQFWADQVNSQNVATKKWYDDIAASELKVDLEGGAITGGADVEVEEPVAAVAAAPVKGGKAAPAPAPAAAAKAAAPAKKK